jgi:glycosyltransferase involved in cell wall biosynthesis
MARADLFVLSSLVEGLPVVLMEAMASGLPVVAPRLTGIPELVIDGKTGMLFAPGNWRALADKVELLLREPARARALAGRARTAVEREFAIDTAVEPLWFRFREAGGSPP